VVAAAQAVAIQLLALEVTADSLPVQQELRTAEVALEALLVSAVRPLP
jgi:hypothetical protein